MTRPVPRVAIDCGGVISLCDADSCGQLGVMESSNAPSDECVAVITRIVELFKAENVFVLSQCRPKMQQQTVIMMGQASACRTCLTHV